MKVEFIKRHFSGIEEGEVKEFAEDHAKRLIDEGYCKEFKAKRTRKKKEETTND